MNIKELTQREKEEQIARHIKWSEDRIASLCNRLVEVDNRLGDVKRDIETIGHTVDRIEYIIRSIEGRIFQ